MEDRNKPKPRKQKYTILTLLFYQKKRIIRKSEANANILFWG